VKEFQEQQRAERRASIAGRIVEGKFIGVRLEGL